MGEESLRRNNRGWNMLNIPLTVHLYNIIRKACPFDFHINNYVLVKLYDIFRDDYVKEYGEDLWTHERATANRTNLEISRTSRANFLRRQQDREQTKEDEEKQ